MIEYDHFLSQILKNKSCYEKDNFNNKVIKISLQNINILENLKNKKWEDVKIVDYTISLFLFFIENDISIISNHIKNKKTLEKNDLKSLIKNLEKNGITLLNNFEFSFPLTEKNLNLINEVKKSIENQYKRNESSIPLKVGLKKENEILLFSSIDVMEYVVVKTKEMETKLRDFFYKLRIDKKVKEKLKEQNINLSFSIDKVYDDKIKCNVTITDKKSRNYIKYTKNTENYIINIINDVLQNEIDFNISNLKLIKGNNTTGLSLISMSLMVDI